MACCLVVVTNADADPNRATPATYEQIELPLSETREQDLQLQLKKNSTAQNIALFPIDRAEEDQVAAFEPYSPLQTLGSLFFVLTLFGCVAYWLRRGNKGSNPLLSEDAWEILGRGNLGAKHDVQLVRLGSRILLLGHSPNTIQTLVEITDPEEVQAMLQRCRRATTITRRFFPKTTRGFLWQDRGPYRSDRPSHSSCICRAPRCLTKL